MNCNPQTVAFAERIALSRHLPAMAHGFTLRTDTGALTITAAEARQHPEIRHAVESILQYRLFLVERAEGVA
ncbi:MAG TPA: hypothetical protein VFN09_07085 [Rhodanobacteraceae bacterium]|nr:hypothetical protein [Rhodanobacteraceae bacterium]